MTGEKTTRALRIAKVNRKLVSLGIEGETPLIVHKWSEKALGMLRLTAAERRKVKKVARDPVGEAMASTYWLDPERTVAGFPLVALKCAMISAAHKDLGIEKTLVKKACHIRCDHPDRLLPMDASPPRIREDIVRVGMGSTDIRYRHEFDKWRVEVRLILDFDLLNDQDLANLVDRAGFGVGVGEWRPEKGGEYGRFRVDPLVPITVEEVV